MSSAGVPPRALIGRIGIALVLCVALVAVGVFTVNRFIDDEIERIPRVALTTSTVENNGTNFLIVGSDSREFVDSDIENQAFGDAGDTGPPKSDTMMVLHANDDRSIAVSFPRDTWVTVPGLGDTKINAAFNNGPQALVDALQQNFDLPINHYLEVDFATFEGLVDAVGGVPVYTEYATRDEYTGLSIGFPFPCTVVNGAQALAYVRSRFPQQFVNGAWRDAQGQGDLDRIERQQKFVRTLGRRVIDRAIDDPTIAPDLADEVVPNLKADAGFDRDAFNALARAFMGLSSGDGSSIEFATLPTSEGRRASQSVQLLVQPDADEMLARLRGDVVVEPAPPADAAGDEAASGPRPGDVRVTVLNGSGVDNAAGNTSNALGNVGFVRGTVGNDSRGTVARSEVRHRSADVAKAQLVASYVAGADLVADDSLRGDVVLVVGKNFAGVAKVEVPASASTPTPTISPEAACTG